MKKVLIIVLSTGVSFMSWGQRSAIQSANNYLGDKDYDHALEYIEKALKDPSTANDPRAWFTRGNIYVAMQQDKKLNAPKSYREAVTSYMKAAEIKPEYEKEAVGNNLTSFAYSYFNDGVIAFNERTPEKYAEAASLMQKVVDIHALEIKSKYDVKKGFDTVTMRAKNVIGDCYLYLNKNSEAIAELTEVKASHMVSSTDIYVHLADIYKKEDKPEEELAIIKEGIEAFPKDESLKTMEINYYIKAGKQDVLVKKLEESVSQHPENSEIWFNLGTIYMNMANPKSGPSPANAAALTTKAQQAYAKAISLDSNNIDYNYNIGAMYYNQGVDLNEKMNAITGTSAAETKKYTELEKQRLELFAKAQPYMEKAFRILDAKGDNMKREDRSTYIAVVTSLREIYVKQNKSELASEMTKRLPVKK